MSNNAATQLKINKVNGDAARDRIAGRFPQSRKEVTLQTSIGDRRVDVLTSEGLAIESKVGKTDLTPEIRLQALKDLELLKDPLSPVKSLRFEFSRSPVTGKVGPSKPLEKFLKEHGFEIVINN